MLSTLLELDVAGCVCQPVNRFRPSLNPVVLGAADSSCQPARVAIVDSLEEILDIQKGIEEITQREEGLISPISWRLRLQIVKVLVSQSMRVLQRPHRPRRHV